jgi:hypothetical protein
VSFASGPGRDDGSLPPVNIVIPDDARELERDVLAYRRELRARRRRQRIVRLFGPLHRRGLGGQAAILPLIATCVALSMLAGAMLSVMTISPAKAPTVSNPQAATSTPPGLTELPSGNVRIDSEALPARNLVSSALALIPAGCDCGPALRRLADQATEAQVSLYFVASGSAMPQLGDLTGQPARRGVSPGRPHRAARLQRRHRAGPDEPARGLPAHLRAARIEPARPVTHVPRRRAREQ